MRPLVLLALAGCAAANSNPAPLTDAQLVDRAREIHGRVLTVDTHVDIPGNWGTPQADPLTRQAQVNLESMREGGLDLAFFAVYVGQGPRTPEGNEAAKRAALQKFDGIRRTALELYPDRIGLALTPDDAERIHRSGRLVAAIGIENGYPIGRDLSLIRTYYDLGARYFGLAHTRNNDICDSSTDPDGPEHGGLSAFGRDVVRELNRVGMMVDISHVSKDCMLQATALSTKPVIASHSSARAVADHPRNLDDEMLRALARNGGVMQTVAFAGYVKVQPPERNQAIQALRQETGIQPRQRWQDLPAAQRTRYEQRMAEIDAQWPPASVRDFVDHIDHAVRLVGVDHVGISSDFDGGGGVVGWNNAAETLNVTVELVRRGYSEEEIRKLWGGNLLRVWAAQSR